MNRVSASCPLRSSSTPPALWGGSRCVLLPFAHFEREVTGERIRDKIAASKRKGMWMGGSEPLGYDLHNRTLTVNEAEAEQVRTIYETYLELGCVSRLRDRLEELGVRSKSRVSGTGLVSGNAVFSRGSLYEMLQNPLYLGQIRHKKLTFPGQHKAILKKELWDRVQKRLASNRPPDAVHGGTSEASWLTGLLFDADGNRFTPSHTTKRGRHYRYYVSLAATQGRKADGRSAPRMPAREIEGIVLKELEAVPALPHRLLQLISDTPSDPEEMNAIVQGANAFGKQLGRHEAMIKAVTKVVLGTDGVTISVCRRTLREVIGLEREGCAEGCVELTVAIDLTRARGVLRFKVVGAEDQSLQEAPALIGAIVKSRGWLDRILHGEATSQRDFLLPRKATTSGTSAGSCRWPSCRLRLQRPCSKASSRSTGASIPYLGRCHLTGGSKGICLTQAEQLIASPSVSALAILRSSRTLTDEKRVDRCQRTTAEQRITPSRHLLTRTRT